MGRDVVCWLLNVPATCKCMGREGEVEGREGFRGRWYGRTVVVVMGVRSL